MSNAKIKVVPNPYSKKENKLFPDHHSPINLTNRWSLLKSWKWHWDHNIPQIKHWWSLVFNVDISFISRRRGPTVDYIRHIYYPVSYKYINTKPTSLKVINSLVSGTIDSSVLCILHFKSELRKIYLLLGRVTTTSSRISFSLKINFQLLNNALALQILDLNARLSSSTKPVPITTET